MSIEAVTWEELYPSLPQMGYLHAARVKKDVEQVRAAFGDTEPYVASLDTGDVLFLMKGTLLKSPNGSAPNVNFVVTLQQPFPNSYPIITVEEPEEPWRFANHPNVDTSGQTYLSTVTRWNPQGSCIYKCVEELKGLLSRNPPFENASRPEVAARPPPRPPQPMAPPPQQQPQQRAAQPAVGYAPQPVQQQPQQQQRYQQQQQQQQRPTQGQQGYDESDALAAVARTTVGIATSAMFLLGGGGAKRRVAQHVVRRTAGNLWEAPQPRGTPQQRQQERMKSDFVLLLQGKLNVPPGTEINTPDGFNIGRFMTSRSAVDDGLLAPGAAPLPGPPCVDPTPAEMVHVAKQREEEDRQRAEAAAAANTSTGSGWKMLSKVGRMAGKVASSAKNVVEDKVRDNSASSDQAKFALDFPTESKTEKLIIEYSCHCLSGDAVSRKGRLYITQRCIFFSGAFDSPAPAQPGVPLPEAVPFRFMKPLPAIVCLLKGECCNKKFLHLLMDDGTFRCFTDFAASTAGAVGSWVSSSMQGTDAYDRCYNWLDHTWRASTMVPNAHYVYAGQPGPLGEARVRQMQPQPAHPTGAAPVASGVYAPPVPQQPQQQSAPQQQQQWPQTAAATTQPAASESTQCIVCMDAQKNAFFQPCGHVCACVKCANQMTECPLCRSKIMEVFPAFL